MTYRDTVYLKQHLGITVILHYICVPQERKGGHTIEISYTEYQLLHHFVYYSKVLSYLSSLSCNSNINSILNLMTYVNGHSIKSWFTYNGDCFSMVNSLVDIHIENQGEEFLYCLNGQAVPAWMIEY